MRYQAGVGSGYERHDLAPSDTPVQLHVAKASQRPVVVRLEHRSDEDDRALRSLLGQPLDLSHVDAVVEASGVQQPQAGQRREPAGGAAGSAHSSGSIPFGTTAVGPDRVDGLQGGADTAHTARPFAPSRAKAWR